MTALPNPHDFTELAPGWTREKKAVFLHHLADKGNVRAACARVGLSREAAYRLRRRDADFARGWAAAMVLAAEAAEEFLATCAIEGIEEEVWYRGELHGTKRRFDTRLLLAHIGRLDKAAGDTRAQADAGRFDELLAVIGGERVPENLKGKDSLLPVERQQIAFEMAEGAMEEQQEQFDRDDAAGVGAELDALDRFAREQERKDALSDAYDRGSASGLRLRDTWRDDAMLSVDLMLDEHEAALSLRTVSTVSTAALAAGLAAGDGMAADGSPGPAQT